MEPNARASWLQARKTGTDSVYSKLAAPKPVQSPWSLDISSEDSTRVAPELADKLRDQKEHFENEKQLFESVHASKQRCLDRAETRVTARLAVLDKWNGRAGEAQLKSEFDERMRALWVPVHVGQKVILFVLP